MCGPYKAILRQLLIVCVSSYVNIFTWYYFTLSLFESVRPHFTHAIIILRHPRCSFPASIPCIDIGYSDACFLTHIVPFKPFPNTKHSIGYVSSKHGEEDWRIYSEYSKIIPLNFVNAVFCIIRSEKQNTMFPILLWTQVYHSV
jgi:hypothetical protein